MKKSTDRHGKVAVLKQRDVNHETEELKEKKGDDGYCLKLDRETMLCSIYDNRPSVCSWYTNDRCEEIRLICLQ